MSMGRYACRVMQQAHRQEIITGLKDATQAGRGARAEKRLLARCQRMHLLGGLLPF